MDNNFQFKITIPTDQGFLGRQCNNSICHRYFKVYANSIKNQMYCPYCGEQFTNDQLWTTDQEKYIDEVITEKALKIVQDEIDEVFGDLASRNTVN